MIWHIIDRFFTHVFSSPGVILAVTFGLALLHRKKPKWTFLPSGALQTLIWGACLTVMGAAIREVYDVRTGGEVKSTFDNISWLLGAILTPIVISKFFKWWKEER